MFLLTAEAAKSLMDKVPGIGACESKLSTPGPCINPRMTICHFAGTTSLSSLDMNLTPIVLWEHSFPWAAYLQKKSNVALEPSSLVPGCFVRGLTYASN